MDMEELPLKERIAIWRQKQRDGTLSEDEMRQIVDALRTSRKAAESVATRKRSAATPVDTTALLDSI